MQSKLVLSKLYTWSCVACGGPSEVVQRSVGVYPFAESRGHRNPVFGARRTVELPVELPAEPHSGQDLEGGVR